MKTDIPTVLQAKLINKHKSSLHKYLRFISMSIKTGYIYFHGYLALLESQHLITTTNLQQNKH